MSIEIKNHLRAFLIAPLTAPFAFYGAISLMMLLGSEPISGLKDQFYIFTATFALACPISYLVTALIGIPYLFILKKKNSLSMAALVVGGLVFGGLSLILLLAGKWFNSPPQTLSMHFVIYIFGLGLGGALLGGGVAYAYAKLAGITMRSTGKPN